MSAIVAFLLLAVAPARAYIPPSEYLIRQVAKKRHGFAGAKIKTTVSAWDGDHSVEGVEFKSVSIPLPKERRVRLLALDASGAVLRVEERKLGAAQPTMMASLFLFETEGSSLIRVLQRWGLPALTEKDLEEFPDEPQRRAAEKEFLARLDSLSGPKIAWVIGTRSATDAGAQLWVEKDGFLPLKLVQTTGKPGSEQERIEIELDRNRVFKDFVFPSTLLLRRNGKLAIREELSDYLSPIPAADLKAAPEVLGWTEKGLAAPEALRALIDLYYERLR